MVPELTILGGVLAAIRDYGEIAVLVIVLWSGSRGNWVWGRQYDDIRQERDRWRDLAISGLHSADRSLQMIESLHSRLG